MRRNVSRYRYRRAERLLGFDYSERRGVVSGNDERFLVHLQRTNRGALRWRDNGIGYGHGQRGQRNLYRHIAWRSGLLSERSGERLVHVDPLIPEWMNPGPAKARIAFRMDRVGSGESPDAQI